VPTTRIGMTSYLSPLSSPMDGIANVWLEYTVQICEAEHYIFAGECHDGLTDGWMDGLLACLLVRSLDMIEEPKSSLPGGKAQLRRMTRGEELPGTYSTYYVHILLLSSSTWNSEKGGERALLHTNLPL
jgi:hypothetical protein